MKNTVRIVLLLAVATATVFLFSCGLLPVSIEQRINDFVNDLNSNRSNAYLNLDPAITAYGAARGNSNYWDSTLGTDVPFSYTPNPAVPSGQTVTINIYAYAGTNLGVYTLTMVNVGTISDNWVIHSMTGPLISF